MSCNFAMVGLHVYGVIFGNPASYTISAAGVSLIYGLVADTLTWDYNSNLNEPFVAALSWYLQLGQMITTICVGLISLLPVFVNGGNFLVILLSAAAAAVGVIGGISGSLLDIATYDLWQYFEFDVIDPFFVDPYISGWDTIDTVTTTTTIVYWYE